MDQIEEPLLWIYQTQKRLNSLRGKLEINIQLANVLSIDQFYKH
jgi:hypothetical protein